MASSVSVVRLEMRGERGLEGVDGMRTRVPPVKRWDGEKGNKNTAQTLKGDRIRVLLITCVCTYLYI